MLFFNRLLIHRKAKKQHRPIVPDRKAKKQHRPIVPEALKFNFPELYLDPVMRAVALIQLGREGEAKAAVSQLLELEPDFKNNGRWLVSRYVKVDDLVDRIIEDLGKAGLDDIDAA